jgi:alanine dehydrogenase
MLMQIGIPTEIKADERRVALTPAGVRELVAHGHDVFIERDAGSGSGIPDAAYEEHGARVLQDPADLFAQADLIVKVKEPQAAELGLLEPRHTLFAYLHLAADPRLATGLMASGATCIAYETIVDGHGRLPLLAPMSEVAGKVAMQAGASMLQSPGGRGVLLGGVPGVARGGVMIVGGGVVGYHAAVIAAGLGARVYILDRDTSRLRELDSLVGGCCSTVYGSALAIEELLPDVDLVVGAVLLVGAKAPRVIHREHLSLMKRHAVVVDVSIDQGGCLETSRPTTHSEPTYEVDGILHYCVANMPGAVPVTATWALTNATLPYLTKLADEGARGALGSDHGFLRGLNVCAGKITYEAVAREQGQEYAAPAQALGLETAAPVVSS